MIGTHTHLRLNLWFHDSANHRIKPVDVSTSPLQPRMRQFWTGKERAGGWDFIVCWLFLHFFVRCQGPCGRCFSRSIFVKNELLNNVCIILLIGIVLRLFFHCVLLVNKQLTRVLVTQLNQTWLNLCANLTLLGPYSPNRAHLIFLVLQNPLLSNLELYFENNPLTTTIAPVDISTCSIY